MTNVSVKDFAQLVAKTRTSTELMNAYIANGHEVCAYVDDNGKMHGDRATVWFTDKLYNVKSLYGRNLPAEARNIVLTENRYFNYAKLGARVKMSAKGDATLELITQIRLNSDAKNMSAEMKNAHIESIDRDIMHALADVNAILNDRGLSNPITYLASERVLISEDDDLNDYQVKSIVADISNELLEYTTMNVNKIQLMMTHVYTCE